MSEPEDAAIRRVSIEFPLFDRMKPEDVGMTAKGASGRPSKGPRERVEFKQPVALKSAAEQRSKALGLTMTDYLNLLVSRDVNFEYGNQEGFDLGISA